jgi:general secretion pathway protein G
MRHSTVPPIVVRARSGAGFTLIEMLCAVAIITTTMAIAAPLYTEALNRARVVRAIADIRTISTTIGSHFIVTGAFPDTLAEVGKGDLKDPWGAPYQYLRIDGGKNGKGAVRKDHKLNPLNADFDLYSMGRNGISKTQISQKDSLDDIIRANDGSFIGPASDY